MFMSTRALHGPWTFNAKNVMKCCVEFLVPDGRISPFARTTRSATGAGGRDPHAQRARPPLTGRSDGAKTGLHGTGSVTGYAEIKASQAAVVRRGPRLPDQQEFDIGCCPRDDVGPTVQDALDKLPDREYVDAEDLSRELTRAS